MTRVFFMTEADRQKEKDALAELQRRIQNTPNRPHYDFDHPAPDVYVAKTPGGGIPALQPAVIVVGTGSDFHDIPGSADCPVYKLLDLMTSGTQGNAELDPVSGLILRVYNLGAAIAGNTWVLVVRDKFGTWFAMMPGGINGGGGSVPAINSFRGFLGLGVPIAIPLEVVFSVPIPIQYSGFPGVEQWNFTGYIIGVDPNDGSESQLIVPYDGTYLIIYDLNFVAVDGVDGTTEFFQAAIYYDGIGSGPAQYGGNQYGYCPPGLSFPASAFTEITGSTMLRMNAGDNVQIRVTRNGSGTSHTTDDTGVSGHLSVAKISE